VGIGLGVWGAGVLRPYNWISELRGSMKRDAGSAGGASPAPTAESDEHLVDVDRGYA
jgi:hypothetical protein